MIARRHHQRRRHRRRRVLAPPRSVESAGNREGHHGFNQQGRSDHEGQRLKRIDVQVFSLRSFGTYFRRVEVIRITWISFPSGPVMKAVVTRVFASRHSETVRVLTTAPVMSGPSMDPVIFLVAAS